MPLVNFFPLWTSGAAIARYPLRLCLCESCGLVMLDEVVPPDLLFRDYHYLTSASQPLIDHFGELAADCRSRGAVHPGSKALDIGANDGSLLLELQKIGARPLGIDPALNAVEKARQRGITVLPLLFNEAVAHDLAPRIGVFDLITCTNVFAHTHEVRSFLNGIDRLLAPGGLVIMEVAHLLDMVVKTQFDVIYHEHVSYFSLRPLTRLFADHGFELFDARKVLTQGGSLRIYARRKSGNPAERSEQLQAIRREEDENHIHELATLQRFAEDVRRFRTDLRELVSDIRRRDLKIVGLGAPAKGVILLNSCEIGADDIAYIVDSTELKQGRLLPGTGIPVLAESALEADSRPADYFLLLSWNFQDSILDKIAAYRAAGAKVIVPFPKLRVI
jgi:novobiocin biosynthesis protein NovU/D-mycarose 3-C-methyltransferase